ncbi:MAG: endonuclease III [Bacilli bacterium]|nr:endonuclease III [Bacilli bacterium]
MAPSEVVLSYLKSRFPEAKCALVFHNDFECLCAIVMSAQTTDRAVNRVTPRLFSDFPTPAALSSAPLEKVESDIRSLGLYRSKAKNLIALSKAIQGSFGGRIPQDRSLLMGLPGVGKKTAGVYLIETKGIPAIPVDTHVSRVASRLGYVKKGTDPGRIEEKLERVFPQGEWIYLHHAFVEFGRAVCHAQNPACRECGLVGVCPYFKKNLSTKGK